MLNTSLPIQILVVDDQDADAFFIEQAFNQSQIDNVVHKVTGGDDAISFLKREAPYEDKPRPQLIILDLVMPQKDGHEILAELKGDEQFCDIPIVVMSASMEESDVRSAYRNHANAYVPKCNGFEDMLDFVSAIEKFWFLKARLPDVAA
ncbi:MAG: response regulator [Alphaproteobacteria bacterium]|nr:response regulator [Alphaproteobacteria bacterium]